MSYEQHDDNTLNFLKRGQEYQHFRLMTFSITLHHPVWFPCFDTSKPQKAQPGHGNLPFEHTTI